MSSMPLNIPLLKYSKSYHYLGNEMSIWPESVGRDVTYAGGNY